MVTGYNTDGQTFYLATNAIPGDGITSSTPLKSLGRSSSASLQHVLEAPDRTRYVIAGRWLTTTPNTPAVTAELETAGH